MARRRFIGSRAPPYPAKTSIPRFIAYRGFESCRPTGRRGAAEPGRIPDCHRRARAACRGRTFPPFRRLRRRAAGAAQSTNLRLNSRPIFGTDPATGKIPAGIETQCSLLFQNVRLIVEAAGGSTENILKISVYVRDKNQREHINKEWLAMFPDPHSRPARHTFQTSDMAEGTLVSCDIMAVFS